jgi:hypothetical protein
MRLDLEFARSPRLPARALALPALGLLVLLLGVAEWQGAREANRILADEITALQDRPVSQPAVPPQQREQHAAREAIGTMLNASWQPAFGAIEAARDKRIALLALDARLAGRQIKLIAESRTLPDALDFVESLQARPELAHASLTQHEIRTDSTYTPVRFHVTLEWRP